MGRLSRPLVPEGPVRTFYDRLHELHLAAGQPSLRQLQRRTRSARRPNGINPTTLHDAFSAPRLSRWEVVREIVRQLGGDVAEFAGLWQRASQAGPDSSAPLEGQPAVVAPAQLPAVVAGFTGRQGDLKRLDQLVPAGDLSTAVPIAVITGMPGVGKTSLAVHWGHQVRRLFPDGQLFVNLRGYTGDVPMPPAAALSYLLRGLGATRVPADLEVSTALYRSLLADRRVLVVLDDAATADQVRPLLPGSPGSLVLVTSRDRLSGLVARDGAYRLELGVFSEAEAHALLRTVLGEQRVAAEPEPTSALARACAYLPLALRVAAENLGQHPGRGIAEQVAGLLGGDRLAALEIDGDEQAGVRRAFDLSYRALGAPERELFRFLGLIPGPSFTVDAAAALAGAGVEAVAVLVRRLVQVHVVGEDGDHYALHDLVRRYSAERAGADESAARLDVAVRRLFDHYLHTADRAAELLYPEKASQRLPIPSAAPGTVVTPLPDRTAALSWLDRELPNLLAAIRGSADNGPLRTAWLLADTLRGYFWMRHYQADWSEAARAALAAAEAAGEPRAQAASLLSLADAEAHRTSRSQAIPSMVRALRLCDESGWVQGQLTVLGKLGSAYLDTGQLREATDCLSRGLDLAERTGARYRAAVLLGILGRVHLQQGRHDSAADLFQQALDRFRALAARQGEAAALDALGEAMRCRGRIAEARAHLTGALAIEREIGDRGTESLTLRNLVLLHLEQGELDQASGFADQMRTVAELVRDDRAEANTLRTAAALAHRRGDHRTAVEHYRRSLPIVRRTGYPYPEVDTLIGLADAYRSLGEADLARQEAQNAHELASRMGYVHLERRAAALLDRLRRPAQAS